MVVKLFLYSFLLCITLQSYAQTEKIDKAYVDKFINEVNTYESTYDENMTHLKKLDSLGRLIDYRLAIFTAHTGIANIERGHDINNAWKSIQILDSLYEIDPNEYSDTLLVHYLLAKGRNLGERNFPLDQLEFFFLADSIADQHKNESLKSVVNMNFSEYYQLNKEYEKSLEYIRQVSAYHKSAKENAYWEIEYAQSLLNIGIVHYKLENYDSSIFYTNASIDAGYLDYGYPYFSYIVLGKCYYSLGEFEEANSYAKKVEEELAGADKYAMEGYEMELLFGQIYTGKNELDKAYEHLSLAKEIVDSMNFKPGVGAVNKALFYWGVKKYECNELTEYFDNCLQINEELFDAEISKKEKQLLVQFETTKKEKRIVELDQKYQKSRTKNLFIVFTLIVVVLITLMIVYRSYTRRKILQQKLQNAELEKQLTRSKLEHSVKSLKEKMDTINGLKRKLSSNNSTDLSHERISNILGNNYIDETQWNEVIYHFDELNNDFCKRVEKKFTGVSKGEIKLLVLVKMGFINKEIADIKGVTIEAIKKAKQRLKKKLEITEFSELKMD